MLKKIELINYQVWWQKFIFSFAVIILVIYLRKIRSRILENIKYINKVYQKMADEGQKSLFNYGAIL